MPDTITGKPGGPATVPGAAAHHRRADPRPLPRHKHRPAYDPAGASPQHNVPGRAVARRQRGHYMALNSSGVRLRRRGGSSWRHSSPPSPWSPRAGTALPPSTSPSPASTASTPTTGQISSAWRWAPIDRIEPQPDNARSPSRSTPAILGGRQAAILSVARQRARAVQIVPAYFRRPQQRRGDPTTVPSSGTTGAQRSAPDSLQPTVPRRLRAPRGVHQLTAANLRGPGRHRPRHGDQTVPKSLHSAIKRTFDIGSTVHQSCSCSSRRCPPAATCSPDRHPTSRRTSPVCSPTPLARSPRPGDSTAR